MSTKTVTRKPQRGYIGDNKHWEEFRAKLEAKGVHCRWAWEARTNPDLKWPNVHCVLFYGDGFQPSVTHAIVVDYNATQAGHDFGFGLFIDDPSNSMDLDIERIAKPRQ